MKRLYVSTLLAFGALYLVGCSKEVVYDVAWWSKHEIEAKKKNEQCNEEGINADVQKKLLQSFSGKYKDRSEKDIFSNKELNCFYANDAVSNIKYNEGTKELPSTITKMDKETNVKKKDRVCL